jgi:hypothetical protein
VFDQFGGAKFIVQQAFGSNIPQTPEDICDPTRLALVVYDMRVGIAKQIEKGQQITDKVVRFSQRLAKWEFGSTSRATCHYRRN